MDFIIKLLTSKDLVIKVKYDSILVIIDRFTKYIRFELYKEAIGVEELVWTVLRSLIANHGTLEEIISDRGSVFILKF